MSYKVGSSERPDLALAVVIGAGGLGMAVARRLGQRHRLLLADVNAATLEQQVGVLKAQGYDAAGAVCDVTDPASVAALAHEARAQGPLRVLAHVAGLSPSMADWRTIMRVNLVGPTLMDEAMLALAGQGTAAIFIASLAGHNVAPPAHTVTLLDAPLAPEFLAALEAAAGPMTSTLAYQLSKFALIRMCARRAAAWGRRGARIVSLSPGMIATPMGALEFERSPVKHALLAKTPLQREGTMHEIGDAVEFLASERASFVTGTDLLVDGGVAAALRHGD
ncbi:MAG: SDR family oxidoreductase [Gammaproteobacteria bacterium]